MGHTYSNILVHIVFSTKERLQLITSDIRSDLHSYMGGIAKEIQATPLQIGGVKDHVHLLLKISHASSVAELVRTIKTNSSRWLHEKSRAYSLFAWQEGYGVFSVSESKASAVISYIAGQEEHHKKVSFQDELLEFLKANKIDYDERYIWK